MTKNEVSLREFMEVKFQGVDDKLEHTNVRLSNLSNMVKGKIERHEEIIEEIKKGTKFAVWAQKNWKTSLFILAIFTIAITSLNLNIVLQLIKLL